VPKGAGRRRWYGDRWGSERAVTLPGYEEFAARLAAVRSRIEMASGSSRQVRTVAVTKGFGPEAVRLAAAAGIEDFGENYAAELLAKLTGAPAGARWHFLGALQRNKIARLAPHVYMWHSLDSEQAALYLARHKPGAAVLVQVKVAGGPARRGLSPDQVPGLVGLARRSGLDVPGLMVVGRAASPPDELRSTFAMVAQLARSLGLSELSMGMSDDFELAVAEGATIVRLGRALFGDRPSQGLPNAASSVPTLGL